MVSILVCASSMLFLLSLCLQDPRTDSSLIGTTNSAVAIMEGKTPRIIENAEGIAASFTLLVSAGAK